MSVKRSLVSAAALCVALLLGVTGCSKAGKQTGIQEDVSSEQEEAVSDDGYQSPYHGELGSAGSLTGRTAVISIFADDAETSWNFDSQEDSDMIEDSLDNLRISTDFLTEQAAVYGSDAQFIWDWELYPDLCYKASFDESLVTEFGDMYDVQKDWVLGNIDEKAIKDEYLADNVIYLFFFNTDFSNQVNPWYLGYSCSSDYYVEFCNIYVRFDDVFVTKPSSYAHEMLHCFGAHDLYYSNAFITQEYVDYMNETSPDDIMFKVYDSKDIPCELSRLDAYYVGILDECEEVTKWNLAASEHIIDN